MGIKTNNPLQKTSSRLHRLEDRVHDSEDSVLTHAKEVATSRRLSLLENSKGLFLFRPLQAVEHGWLPQAQWHLSPSAAYRLISYAEPPSASWLPTTNNICQTSVAQLLGMLSSVISGGLFFPNRPCCPQHYHASCARVANELVEGLSQIHLIRITLALFSNTGLGAHGFSSD